MSRIIAPLLSIVFVAFDTTPALAQITIDTVPVGDVGNAPDKNYFGHGQFGAVPYSYRIGKYEVTNSQYAEFLNAKAASDPLSLYNPLMGGNVRGGITRNGSDGTYSYAAKVNMGNKPVTFVGWYDSIRFVNWLHNGQGTGDTETGAYTLLGGTPTPTNGLSVTRNSGANWWLPSEDEWYKSAYHQPATQGGDSDNYWDYPTASNSEPTLAAANLVGDISNPGPNVANHFAGADWNGLNGQVTTVGSAGPLSNSFYGTSDQGGNVWEWNEALIGSFRGLRGGAWNLESASLLASIRGSSSGFPTDEGTVIGFRVATIPEPSTLALAAIGTVGLLAFAVCRRRFRFVTFVIVGLLLASGCASPTLAAPVQWAGNGHYYEFVSTRLNWAVALADANSRTYLGLTGYLATVTSSAENVVISSLLADADWGAWLGGSDAAVEGSWYWVVGPELGVQFWQGNENGVPVGGAFNAWDFNEPNNTNNEDTVAIWGPNGASGPSSWGRWNDFQGSDTQGYVVEYSAIPESSTLALAGMGALALFARGVRRRRV